MSDNVKPLTHREFTKYLLATNVNHRYNVIGIRSTNQLDIGYEIVETTYKSMYFLLDLTLGLSIGIAIGLSIVVVGDIIKKQN